MGNQQFKHILNIREGFQASSKVKESLNNSIETLANDLYSKDTHFIFELIQNAEDNDYNTSEPSFSFYLSQSDPTNTPGAKGALIVQNNEQGFLPDHVDALCAVGKTTKNKPQGYIGEKGIGFKSVFRITTIPHIFSNGYCFCLPKYDKESGLGYIIPCWVDNIPKGVNPFSQTTIILPLDREDFGYNKIEDMLHDIKPETILFLNKLKNIEIKTDSGVELTLQKDDSHYPMVDLLRDEIKKEESFISIDEYLLYKKTFPKPDTIQHEKRQKIKEREVTIALPKNEEEEYIGKIFAYLPIKSNQGLPFSINADFILPSSREDIHDIPWNRWLIDCIATLIGNSLEIMKKKGLLTEKWLDYFADKIVQLKKEEDNILDPIYEKVCDAFKEKALLPAHDGTYISAKNAIIARGADLLKILSNEQLCLLLEKNTEVKWLSGTVTRDKTPALHSFLRYELNVEELYPALFANKITESFIERQPDNWLITFYKYLTTQEALWRPGYGWFDEGILRKKPILRLEDNTHVKPFQSDGKPNAFLPPSYETDFPIIKRNICNDEQASEFLKRLDLSEPDIFDYIINKILSKYKHGDTQSISLDEHKQDFHEFLKAINEDSEVGKKKLIDIAKRTPFLLADNNKGKVFYKKPKEIYINDEKLQVYFSETAAWFLHEIYEDFKVDKDFWLDLGVKRHPRLINVSEVPPEIKERSTREEYITNYTLEGLNNFMEHLDSLSDFFEKKRKALILWNYLRDYHECVPFIFTGDYEWFYFHPRNKSFTSQLAKTLRQFAWIPTQEKVFKKPEDIFYDELSDEFHASWDLIVDLGIRQTRKPDDWENIEEEQQKYASELGVDLEDIEFVKQHVDEFKQWKESLSKKTEKPAFPEKVPSNPERREETILEEWDESSEKTYQIRERQVRTTRRDIEPGLWLKNHYTNDSNQMLCQICKDEMPFKKRNGEYYFETVEAFSNDFFTKEHEAQYLALCPVCAAMYKEFIKSEETKMKQLKKGIMNNDDLEIPIQLGEFDSSIRFVKSHLLDMQTILEESVTEHG